MSFRTQKGKRSTGNQPPCKRPMPCTCAKAQVAEALRHAVENIDGNRGGSGM